MNLHDIATAGVGLWAFAHAAVHAWAVRRRSIPSTTPKDTIMSDTAPAAVAAPAPVPVPAQHVPVFAVLHGWATRAIEAMTMVGTEWAAIKANPLYGALATAAVSAAKAELMSKGIPIEGVVNVELGVESILNGLAAAHPTINTTPQAAPIA